MVPLCAARMLLGSLWSRQSIYCEEDNDVNVESGCFGFQRQFSAR
jgi:hypothetical protein